MITKSGPRGSCGGVGLVRVLNLSVLTVLVCLAASTFAAPAPPVPKPTAEQVEAVLGKPVAGTEVSTLVKALGVLPEADYAFWKYPKTKASAAKFDLLWRQQGLRLLIRNEQVELAWLYNQDVDGFGRYSGQLPGGLTFDDTPETVAKAFGPPTTKPFLLERQLGKGGPVVNAVQLSYVRGKIGYDVEFREVKPGVHRIALIVPHLK